jgi:hypothetical protein
VLLKIAVVLVLLWTALNCLAAADAPPAAMKKIAVVTVLDDELEVGLVATMVFDNLHYLGDVGAWRLSDEVSAAAAAELGRRGFENVALPYDRPVLWGEYSKTQDFGSRLNSALGGTSVLDALTPSLAGLAANSVVDGILLVIPGHGSGRRCPPYGCSDYGNTGFGVHIVTSVLPPYREWRGETAYISLRLYLPDAKSFKPLADTSVMVGHAVTFGRIESFSDVPERTLTQVEQAILGLIGTALPDAIIRLGVVPETPAQSAPLVQAPNLKVISPDGGIGDSIAKAYVGAVAGSNLEVGPETATLTVKEITSRGNFFAPRRSINSIAAVLSFRGSEYWLKDSALLGSIRTVADSIGRMAWERIQGGSAIQGTKKTDADAASRP